MERLRISDQEVNIDGVDTGPTSQAEHRAKKVEFYRGQKPLGAPRMPEVVIEKIEETAQQEREE